MSIAGKRDALGASSSSVRPETWRADDSLKVPDTRPSPFRNRLDPRAWIDDDAPVSPRSEIPSDNGMTPWDQANEWLPTPLHSSLTDPSTHPALKADSTESPQPLGTMPGSFINNGLQTPGFISSLNSPDPYPDGDRRPSVTSVTTTSSTGSGRSHHRLHKKLKGMFNEEYPEDHDRAGSDFNLPSSATKTSADKTGRRSLAPLERSITQPGSPATPALSRPKTAVEPSSEITPWVYQDPEDINHYSAAPVRQNPIGFDGSRFADQRHASNAPKSPHNHPHRLHLHRHRHNKSSDDYETSGTSDYFQRRPLPKGETFPDYPSDTRKASSAFPTKQPTGHAISSMDGASSMKGNNGSKRHGVESTGGKRSLLNRIIHRGRPERNNVDALKGLTGSSSSVQSAGKAAASDVRNGSAVQESIARRSEETSPVRPPLTQVQSRRDHIATKLAFKARRGTSAEFPIRDANNVKVDRAGNDALWNLDTDLTQMEGIISSNQGPATPPVAPGNPIWAGDDNIPVPGSISGAWDAPDSWAIKRAGDENVGRLRAIDETGIPPHEDDPGRPYAIRVFKQDSTFSTLSIGLNTTAAEIVQILGKKTILQDALDTYQIIMRRHETSRQLDPGERPLVLQKKLLESVGYNDSDHIEELGREDHSYLCRFNFLPSKSIGYSSFSKDPGFSKQQKFSNLDLQGRNLITIPIALYQKSSEIVVLNLSRNISLDVPRDFIRGCVNLREIKYTSNEAWSLPPSFSLASKLTVLDLSNNRLEQLEHAELHRLTSLASLKLSNNKLKSLPAYFSQFRGLRSLNLSSNALVEFPTALCDVNSLIELDISFNSLSNVDPLSKLRNLERFWATNNKLKGRPDKHVGNLLSLREVDIRFNMIDNIDTLAELPQLEHLLAGHNSITAFEGTFSKLRTLYLDHNPVTHFNLGAPIPSLSTLSLASAKLSQFSDELFIKLSGLTKLILDKNHFVSLPSTLGRLLKLDHLSVARNALSTLPPEVGRLGELRFLDVRDNNINLLPPELWFCRKLETLNLSSNVLDSFPKPPSQSSMAVFEAGMSGLSTGTPSLMSATGIPEEENDVGTSGPRRESQASGITSNGSEFGTPHRKNSLASTYGSAITSRKPSVLTRTPTMSDSISTVTRKDSLMINRASSTLAGSIRHLYLADNRLSDDVFDQLSSLQELRIVNLSYNALYEMPPRTIRKWQYLSELYLSGNGLSALPSEDLEELGNLRVLHINANKFQNLPPELEKVNKLAVLDVGSNQLKYNVSNWPYDWNWNCNPNLKYLSLSGNKRLEIRPPAPHHDGKETRNTTDFNSLSGLRVLGLMDVTLMISSVPDETENKRVRTSGSNVGTMGYGVSDTLGRNEHLSTLDLVIPRLENEDEMLIGLFDGTSASNGGSRIAKFLHQNFKDRFRSEMQRKDKDETPKDALRRTYLSLNKELATVANQRQESRDRRGTQSSRVPPTPPLLYESDSIAGCVATVLFLQGTDLWVSNVGDAEAVLVKSEDRHIVITQKHDPASIAERQRITQAGGYVSRQGKLNDALDVSRAFGFVNHMPSLIACPYVAQIKLEESDQMVILASREMWDYLTPDFAVDLARSERVDLRVDLMRVAQKLRDLAIAFGASSKITVMIIGVGEIRRRERARYRPSDMSMGPSGLPDVDFNSSSRRKKGRDLDSRLARLDLEVDAPVGEVSLVFTDIKNSTHLWETYPIAMRSAIKLHNVVMRRQLRSIGGYEVKTEGDAFMVAFPTVTSALLWCFKIQSLLLEVQWPQEILNSVNGQVVCDADGNILFRGLSVRMGIHWGQPVCEIDPVTRRMDYFGPMVNRSARISAVADGGQITVSAEFIAEVQRLLETHIESDRTNSTGSEDTMGDDTNSQAIRGELRSLSSHGFEVKDLGERRLKGLENPEQIYLMYPHTLAGRLIIQQQRAEQEKASADGAGAKSRDSQLAIDLENVWDIWAVCLRLEMLCSTLESPDDSGMLKPPETALLERTRQRGGEVTDRFLINFVEHQICRIETCITSLALRNMIRPFHNGMMGQAGPMSEILDELSEQLAEMRAWKEQDQIEMADS